MQPHTYSRVKTLFQDYIHCCDLADDVLEFLEQRIDAVDDFGHLVVAVDVETSREVE